MKYIKILFVAFIFLLADGCGNTRITVTKTIEELQENIKNDPNNEVAHYSLGLGYISKSKYAEAIAAFKDALKIDGHFSEAHYAIYCVEQAIDANLVKEMRKDIPSKEYSDKVNEISKHFNMAFLSNPLFERKLGYLLLPPKEQADNYAQQIINDHYKLYYSLFYDGYENFIVGNYEEAIKYFNHIIDEVPSGTEEEKILRYSAKGSHKPYEQFLKEYKRDARIRRGIAYAFNKNYALAIGDFSAIADTMQSRNRENILSEYLNPAHLYYYIGHCYLSLTDLPKAEEAFIKTLTEDYSLYMAHFYLSEIYHKQKRNNEALKELDAAIIVAPDDPLMHYNKAVFLFEMKEYESALEEYEKAIRINPMHFRSRYNAAILYEAMDNREKALEHYQGFLEGAPLEQAALISQVKEKLNSLKVNYRL